jgi:tetratricopeptide (TPR) repeat protein
MTRSIAVAGAMFAIACADPQIAKQRHVERGDAYTRDSQLEFAAVEYANAVDIDPQLGTARYKLAETYERLNRLHEAYAEFIRAADVLPDRDVQLKAIEVLLLVGRFDEAKARAGSLLARNAKDVDALLLRANATAALKDPAGAVAEIEQAIALRPADSRALVSLGMVQLHRGQAREAEAAYRQALALDPQSVDARLALANYLWMTERATEAEQAIRQALAIDAEHLIANRMLGLLYLSTGRAAQAEAPIKAMADRSGMPEARLQLAEYYLTTNRLDEAVGLLSQLASVPAVADAAELRLASLDYSRQRHSEARARLDRVLSKDRRNVSAHLLLAEWLMHEGRLDEARARTELAIAAAPDSAPAHFALATIHERRGDVDAAITRYHEVLRSNPRAAAAQVALSRLSLARGNREAALRHAEDATLSEPANQAARIALIRTLLVRGDLNRADRELQALTKTATNVAVLHTLQGALYARRQNVDEARASFERARALAPQLTEAVAGLVALDLQTKNVPAAVARIEAELRDSPVRADLLMLAAQVYEAAGHATQAEQSLKRAVSIDPRLSSAYVRLAGLYLKQRRLDEARAEFEAIVTHEPTSAGARTMLGVILEAQDKREEAARSYETTLGAVPSAPIAANNLAMIYADAGRQLDQALQLATLAKQELPDNPDVDDTLGWVYYKKNLPALAIRPLEESLRKRPDSPEVLYHLGLTQAKLGQTADARASLERSLALKPQFPGSDIARDTIASIDRTAR